MRALAAATRRRIEEAVGRSALDPGVTAFIHAVVLQAARPLGAPRRRGIIRHEGELAERVVGLLAASVGHTGTVAGTASELAAEPPLLSAFFQNLDLLPPAGSPVADAIALLVVMGLSRLEEAGMTTGTL